MRLNKYLSTNTSLSRRSADAAIIDGRVKVNNELASVTTFVGINDKVFLDNKLILPSINKAPKIVLLNKPTGIVCSRYGQGSKTVYDLLPKDLSNLNIAGRLDKDSCGLVVLTDDGSLLYKLTHPSQNKTKIYKISLNKALASSDWADIQNNGVNLDDGHSSFYLKKINNSNINWQITMAEGRNRQIRRTFQALGYTVTNLKRVKMGPYILGKLKSGEHILVPHNKKLYNT